jgi:hypothetical protein
MQKVAPNLSKATENKLTDLLRIPQIVRTGIPSIFKRTSVLRRIPELTKIELKSKPGNEGDVCAFQLLDDQPSLTMESAYSAATMFLVPGDNFLGTPGNREARHWSVGGIPKGGLVPGSDYWVLSESGIVGELISYGRLMLPALGGIGRVRYLGAVSGEDGETLNIRRFALSGTGKDDRRAPVYLIIGTSSEVGKTTAGVAVLRSLRRQGYAKIIVFKANGTAFISETAIYRDFGASEVLNCVDFGLPAVYPVSRTGIMELLAGMLDYCLSQPADAVIVECAGDAVSSNAPELLSCLKARRTDLTVVLAAADALGAYGAKQAVKAMDLSIHLITGPCTDNPTLRERTEALCGIPAMNVRDGKE